MKFLIAHQSKLYQSRIRQEVARLDQSAQFLAANELTETYHLTEHHAPDCVLIGENMTLCGEFELVASLFGILGVHCIVIKDNPSSPSQHPVFSKFSQLSEQELGNALHIIGNTTGPAMAKSSKEKGAHSKVAHYDPKRLILIGASTGGIDALLTVTQVFDSTCPPTLIVQHTGGQFAKSLIRLLNGACQANVQAATEGMCLAAGNIYLAPDDQCHLVLSPGAKPRIHLDSSPEISGHRPSIDALFASGAFMAPYISAALLTGMGKDGAEGLTNLRAKGAHTIGQDQKTSVVYGMPRVAMEMGGVCEQLPLQSIGSALLKSCKQKVRI